MYYELFFQINMKPFTKGFLSLHDLVRSQFVVKRTLSLSRVSTVLSAISILLLALRQLLQNLNYRVSNIKA